MLLPLPRVRPPHRCRGVSWMLSLSLSLSLVGCAALHQTRQGEEAASRGDWSAAYAAYAQAAAARPGSAAAQGRLDAARAEVLSRLETAVTADLQSEHFPEALGRLEEARRVQASDTWLWAHQDRIAAGVEGVVRRQLRDDQFSAAWGLLLPLAPPLAPRLTGLIGEVQQSWSAQLQQEAAAAEAQGDLAVAHVLLEGALRLTPSPSLEDRQTQVWSALLSQTWGGLHVRVQGPGAYPTTLQDALKGAWSISPWSATPVHLDAPPPRPHLSVQATLSTVACTQTRIGVEERVHVYPDGTRIPNPEVARLKQSLTTTARSLEGTRQAQKATEAPLERALRAEEAATLDLQTSIAQRETARREHHDSKTRLDAAREQEAASRTAVAGLTAREAEVQELLRKQGENAQAASHLERAVLPPRVAATQTAQAQRDDLAPKTAAKVALADQARAQEATDQQQVTAREAALKAALKAAKDHEAKQSHLQGQLPGMKQRAAQAQAAQATAEAALREREAAVAEARLQVKAAEEQRAEREAAHQEAQKALVDARRLRSNPNLPPEEAARLDAALPALATTASETKDALQKQAAALRPKAEALEAAEAQHRQAIAQAEQAATQAEQAATALQQVEAELAQGPSTGRTLQAAWEEAEEARRRARMALTVSAAARVQAEQTEAAAQARLNQAEQTLKQAQRAEETVRAELASRSQDGDTMTRRLTELKAELEALAPSVALLPTREAERLKAEQQHAASQRALATAETAVTQRQAAEQAARQEVEALRAEQARLHTQQATQEAEIRSLEGALARAPAEVDRLREYFYTVEKWDRACRASARGVLGEAGRVWESTAETHSQDEAHPGFAPGGLAADSRQYTSPDAVVLSGLVGDLARSLQAEVATEMTQTAARVLAEPTRWGAGREGETRALLLADWMRSGALVEERRQQLATHYVLPPEGAYRASGAPEDR